MKVEVISSEEFFIFVNLLYAKISDYDNKEEIIKVVKEIIANISGKLRLKGFYKIKVYVNEKTGLFIEGVLLDGIERNNVVDLRVIVYFDEDIYFKTDDYFKIRDVSNVHYLDGNYYCLVDDIMDMDSVVEFGEFVYGKEMYDVFDRGILI